MSSTDSRGRPEHSVRSCGLCGQTRYEHWWRKVGYDIGRCRNCGLVQVLQDLSEAELAQLYTESYYNGGSAEVYKNYLADPVAKRAHFGAKLDELCRDNRLTAPGSCLEIGCAYGLFLAEARDRGWQVRGIEVSEASAQWARANLGLSVDSSPTALNAIPAATQDLVVMWDVIEHLRDPLEVLGQIRRVLRTGGVLAISTGDIGSLGARLYGKRWLLVSPPYHQFYFDRTSIRRILDAAGFKVRTILSEGHPLDNWGHPKALSWIAKRDKYIAWRLDSGPIMNVTAECAA